MASIQEVRNLLRNLSVDVSRKKNGCFPVTYRGSKFRLKENDVDEYLSQKSQISRPEETAIFLVGHYEHAIELQGRGPAVWRLFRDKDSINLDSRDSKVSIELSTISSLFALSLIDQDPFHRELRRFLAMRINLHNKRPPSDQPDFTELFGRITTIKVKTTPEHNFCKNQKQLKAIAEAGLFHIAYGNGTGISFSKSWERAYYWLGTRRNESVQFPLRTYNTELLAYYQLAIGSESLILAYLALYKILEYFFTSSSEKVLHDKIKEKLILPDFSHTKPAKIRDLLATIRRLDQKMDEKRMLVTVLQQYFDKTEIIDWLNNIESESKQYFMNMKEVFGEEHKIDLNESQLFPTIANRIYHIRNALVHHKEGEVSRFIPFSGQEAILFKETPLILHLAEQLIVKTGRDIQL